MPPSRTKPIHEGRAHDKRGGETPTAGRPEDSPDVSADDPIDEASQESFPASDPPAWISREPRIENAAPAPPEGHHPDPKATPAA